MIHYHGTPTGGKRDGVAKFLQGRHAFVPYPRQEDLGIALEVCKTVAVDNGAYTIWKQGGVLDVNGYAEWIEEIRRHPTFSWCVAPDSIEGDEDENDALLRDWPHDASVSVPVWHYHESLSRLDRLVGNYPRVALGSSGDYATPGTESWWRRTDEAMRVACDPLGRPRAKLHGLRMLSPEIFSSLPLASADSTNAAMNSGSVMRFGMYTPPTTWQRAAVIAERIEAFNSAAVYQFSRQLTMF